MKTLTPHFLRLSRAGRLGLGLVLLLGPLLGLALRTLPARSDPFVDPAFTALWTRTDQPVAGHQATRTWLWGPAPGAAKREAYAEGSGGVRLVQYFDKGRMEINNPNADPTAPGFVTGGLLSVELISGRLQTGNTRFENRAAAQIPLASDRDDPAAPTYASFAAVSSLVGGEHQAPSAVGNPVDQAIARDGSVTPFGGAAGYGVAYAAYEPLTHHNIAAVFWQFLNSTGLVQTADGLTDAPLFNPRYALTGLPISEAYWAQVKVAGTRRDVLIQAFQRRVLTYLPANPPAFQVELGNIGLHYLEWRYTPGAAPTLIPLPGGPPVPAALANVAVTAINPGRSGLDLNEQTVSLINNGSSPVPLGGWRLVSPKNDHLDTYNFPPGFVLPAGATLTVYAGQGLDSATKLYMRRITWLFDSTGFDGVFLYDGLGREVSRFFLQGGVAPTLPPAPADATATPADATATPSDATATPTPADNPTATVTATAAADAGTPTVTATPGGPTATITATPAKGTGTATPATALGTATPTATLQTRDGTATPTATVRP
ncbi:MAG: lamin tail domain-containing protein [Chloroflexota bacterium]|nr:lamin tail domain-containing protein [Chloroflexota bacterium]